MCDKNLIFNDKNEKFSNKFKDVILQRKLF